MSLLSLLHFSAFVSPDTIDTPLATQAEQLVEAIEEGDVAFVEDVLNDDTYIDPRFADLAYACGHRDIALILRRHMVGQDLRAPNRIV